MEDKKSKVGMIVAIVLSVLLVPMLLLFGFAGATTSAVSNVFAEQREDELFASFENAGGIRWIYGEIEVMLADMNKELQMPEEADLLDNVVTYEEVSAMLHGVYSAVLNGETYRFHLTIQKERIRENIEAYFNRYMEEQKLTELPNAEEVKSEYINEAYERLDEEILYLEEELNARIEEISDMAQLQDVAVIGILYDTEGNLLMLIRESLRTAVFAEIGIMAVLAVLLLVSYLFRPSGFFVAGVTAVVSGGLAMAASIIFQNRILSLVLSSAEIPHESLYTVARQVLSWCSDGYRKFAVCSAIVGVVFILLGVILLLVRKNSRPEVGNADRK